METKEGTATHRCETVPPPNPKCMEHGCQLVAQPQRSGQWTVSRLASYINREGHLNDTQLLFDINAELAEAYANGDRDRLEKIILQTNAERKGGEQNV